MVEALSLQVMKSVLLLIGVFHQVELLSNHYTVQNFNKKDVFHISTLKKPNVSVAFLTRMLKKNIYLQIIHNICRY
jgi:hypothetical protein